MNLGTIALSKYKIYKDEHDAERLVIKTHSLPLDVRARITIRLSPGYLSLNCELLVFTSQTSSGSSGT